MNKEQIEKLKELALAAENEVIRSHGWSGSVEMLETLRIDEEYLTAASPASILELIAVAERASPAPAVVAEGWKLVPIEPTVEMLMKAGASMPDMFDVGDEYRAMVESAPAPPKDGDCQSCIGDKCTTGKQCVAYELAAPLVAQAPDTQRKAALWDFFNARLMSRSGIVLNDEKDCQSAVDQWAETHETHLTYQQKMRDAEAIALRGVTIHTAMHTFTPSPDLQAVAQAIHYPECWDTAAYPALADALDAVYASFKCTDERHADLQAGQDARDSALREVTNKFDDIRDALKETYGFASTSPASQDNINFALAQQLREYALNPGFSHNDYADTMQEASVAIPALIDRLKKAEASEKLLSSMYHAAADRADKLTIELAALREQKPVLFVESDPQICDKGAAYAINSLCHTVVYHMEKPDTSNPVWPLYASPIAAPVPATQPKAECCNHNCNQGRNCPNR